MLYAITGYKNTGFTSADRPSNPGVLALAETVSFQSNWLLQDLDFASMRIQTTYENIRDVDYIKVTGEDNTTAYYVVNGIRMLNAETAEIGLIFDALLTCGGIAAITVLSGWTKRAHAASDGLFENTIPESWTPTVPMVNDTIRLVGDDGTGEPVNLINSTVDLTSTSKYADEYLQKGTDATTLVSVPQLPKPYTRTTIITPMPDNTTKQFTNVLTEFFFADEELVKDGMQSTRSLGVESAVVNAFQVPASYFAYTVEDTHRIFTPDDETLHTVGLVRLRGVKVSITGDSYKYRELKNNKVFAMYNTYRVISVASGASEEYEAKDIFNDDTAPSFIIISDVNYDGRPYMQPVTFDRQATKFGQQSVPGGVWLNLPIAFYTASGSLNTAIEAHNKAYDLTVNRGLTQSSRLVGMGTDLLQSRGNRKAVGGLIGSAIEYADAEQAYNRNIHDMAFQGDASINTIPPDIKFPQSTGVQAYVGNGFYLNRYRLADNDADRLDRFLTMYGYAQDKPFEKSDLTNRVHFNFIKTENANIKCSSSIRIREAVNALFDAGVRLWHELPNSAAYADNPIR